MHKHPNSMTSEERQSARFRPAGSEALHLEDGNSVIYYGERNGHYFAHAYRGKSVNTTMRYAFPTEAARARFMERFAASVAETNAARAKRRDARKAAGHSLRVGDILSASWGYEQTNVDYYQVTRATEKSVWVRKVAAQCEQTQHLAGHSVPVPGRFIGEETGPHRASGESATCGYNGATKVNCVEVAGVKSYAPQYWSAYA